MWFYLWKMQCWLKHGYMFQLQLTELCFNAYAITLDALYLPLLFKNVRIVILEAASLDLSKFLARPSHYSYSVSIFKLFLKNNEMIK